MSVLSALRGELAEHHVRVLDKVAVDGVSVWRCSEVYPVCVNLNRTVTLLEKDDVADYIRPGIGAKGVVGKSDSAQKLSPLCEILSDFGRLFIKGELGRYESDDAAGTNLVNGLGKEIIVDAEAELVIRFVRNLVLAKRHISYGKVKEVAAIRLFKARNGDVCLRVELPRYAPGQAVQLNAVQARSCHAFRQHTKEVADTH